MLLMMMFFRTSFLSLVAAAKLSLKLAELFFFLRLGYHPLVGVEVEKVKMRTFLGGRW